MQNTTNTPAGHLVAVVGAGSIDRSRLVRMGRAEWVALTTWAAEQYSARLPEGITVTRLGRVYVTDDAMGTYQALHMVRELNAMADDLMATLPAEMLR